MDPKQRCVFTVPRTLLSVAVSGALLASQVNTAAADIAVPGLPAVTVGVGVQTGFYDCQNSCLYSPGSVSTPNGSVSGFALDTIRLYVNGSVTDTIKMTFNTEYTGSGNDSVVVMDAIGRFEFSDMLNIWVGRFLPPSDRANLYGPYYANDWTPYADGVADFYPDVAIGRDNGVAYWGDFGPAKLQVGLFDGQSLAHPNPLIGNATAAPNPDKILVAGRLTWDFWDKEKGYYFNGTYYGDKDLLALAGAFQTLDSKTDFSIDGIMEKNLKGAGVVGIESEYQHDNGLNTTASNHGWYVLGDYLFPQVIGWGKFQLLDKYSQKTFDATSLSASLKNKYNEVNINYIIKEFSARVGMYYLTKTSDVPASSSPKEFGIKLQLQM
jgi:hypothetical protein